MFSIYALHRIIEKQYCNARDWFIFMVDYNSGHDGNGRGRPGPANQFDALIRAVQAATSSNMIMAELRGRILDVYQVDMASIFLIDAAKMQLVSWVLLPGSQLRKIRLPVNKTSIAGFCAVTRQVVLVSDAYDRQELGQIDAELRFDCSWDRQAGYRTRQVVAVPIMYKHFLMGVIQLMNPRDRIDFSEQDCRQIADLARILGVAFRSLQR